MKCRRGGERPGAPEREECIPTPGFPAQRLVDQPKQEREQRGGVVVSSYRMTVRWPVFLLGRRPLYRGVFEERGVRELVQRPEGPVAEEQRSHEEER
jgi:hypothetical protein